MKNKIYYVVETTEIGYSEYLDGFRNGQPVWKSCLQAIDPFISYATALGESKKCPGAFVTPITTDDEGRNKLVI